MSNLSQTAPQAVIQSPLVDLKSGLATKIFQLWITAVGQAVANLLAPQASPTFSGVVTQPLPSVLTSATTASSAVAGTSSALPATPAGYLEMQINGNVYLVPYYSVI
jgi:hypothetical protein